MTHQSTTLPKYIKWFYMKLVAKMKKLKAWWTGEFTTLSSEQGRASLDSMTSYLP